MKGKILNDKVLYWDPKNEEHGKRGKWDPTWLGPYYISSIVGSHTFKLISMEGDQVPIPING